MNVYVDACRIYVEVQHVGHLLALGNQVLVGGHHGLVEVGVAHEASVNEEELVQTLLTRRLWPAGEAGKPQHARLHLHLNQPLAEPTAQYVVNPLTQAGGWQLHE